MISTLFQKMSDIVGHIKIFATSWSVYNNFGFINLVRVPLNRKLLFDLHTQNMLIMFCLT